MLGLKMRKDGKPLNGRILKCVRRSHHSFGMVGKG